jgi:hypothetical protein
LADEEAAVGAFDDGSDDVEHGEMLVGMD